MKNALEAWPEIVRKAAGRDIFLFLDFDGTLAPIVGTPDKAALPQETRTILARFGDAPNSRLAIISGRSIEDLRQRVGLDKAIYAGSHGLEVRGPGVEHSVPLMPRLSSIMEQIKQDLKSLLSGIAGVVLEDKGLCVGVHYRLVKREDMRSFMKGLHTAVDSFLVRGKVKIKSGKKVFEIMPPSGWDKGKVVLWLLEQSRGDSKSGMLPLYIGDDATDEDAFEALGGKGVCVAVGRAGNTSAPYNLKDTAEVAEFLNKLAEFKKSDERID